MTKDWFISSSGKGLSATLAGLAGLGGLSVAEMVGGLEMITNGVVRVLTAVNLPADQAVLHQFVVALFGLLFGGYFVFGFSRKVVSMFQK